MKTREQIWNDIATWETNGKDITHKRENLEYKTITFRTKYATNNKIRSIAGENEYLIDAYPTGGLEVTIWY